MVLLLLLLLLNQYWAGKLGEGYSYTLINNIILNIYFCFLRPHFPPQNLCFNVISWLVHLRSDPSNGQHIFFLMFVNLIFEFIWIKTCILSPSFFFVDFVLFTFDVFCFCYMFKTMLLHWFRILIAMWIDFRSSCSIAVFHNVFFCFNQVVSMLQTKFLVAVSSLISTQFTSFDLKTHKNRISNWTFN